MMAGGDPQLADRDVMLVMAADKMVAFRSLVERAHRSPDEREFWRKREALRNLLGYFARWCWMAETVVPAQMSEDLAIALRRLTLAALPDAR